MTVLTLAGVSHLVSASQVRFRVNVADTIQSRPNSGLDLQAKGLQTFRVCFGLEAALKRIQEKLLEAESEHFLRVVLGGGHVTRRYPGALVPGTNRLFTLDKRRPRVFFVNGFYDMPIAKHEW